MPTPKIDPLDISQEPAFRALSTEAKALYRTLQHSRWRTVIPWLFVAHPAMLDEDGGEQPGYTERNAPELVASGLVEYDESERLWRLPWEQVARSAYPTTKTALTQWVAYCAHNLRGAPLARDSAAWIAREVEAHTKVAPWEVAKVVPLLLTLGIDKPQQVPSEPARHAPDSRLTLPDTARQVFEKPLYTSADEPPSVPLSAWILAMQGGGCGWQVGVEVSGCPKSDKPNIDRLVENLSTKKRILGDKNLRVQPAESIGGFETTEHAKQKKIDTGGPNPDPSFVPSRSGVLGLEQLPSAPPIGASALPVATKSRSGEALPLPGFDSQDCQVAPEQQQNKTADNACSQARGDVQLERVLKHPSISPPPEPSSLPEVHDGVLLDPVQEVYAHWVKGHPTCSATPSKRRQTRITKLLKRYSVADLKTIIDGNILLYGHKGRASAVDLQFALQEHRLEEHLRAGRQGGVVTGFSQALPAPIQEAAETVYAHWLSKRPPVGTPPMFRRKDRDLIAQWLTGSVVEDGERIPPLTAQDLCDGIDGNFASEYCRQKNYHELTTIFGGGYDRLHRYRTHGGSLRTKAASIAQQRAQFALESEPGEPTTTTLVRGADATWPAIRQVYDFWLAKNPVEGTAPPLRQADARLIGEWLLGYAEGTDVLKPMTADDLCDAVEGIHLDPWHRERGLCELSRIFGKGYEELMRWRRAGGATYRKNKADEEFYGPTRDAFAHTEQLRGDPANIGSPEDFSALLHQMAGRPLQPNTAATEASVPPHPSGAIHASPRVQAPISQAH